MKNARTRCQLFLPEALAGRLGRIAEGSGRSRSDILAEALEAWLGRRSGSMEEGLQARLARLDANVAAMRRQQGLQWEVLARMMRHQMIATAGLPRPDAALEAAAARQFEAVVDELAGRLAGRGPPAPADPAIEKVRTFV